MKLICAKNELLKSVNISLKAVSSKTTMPILECILIDASATEITFTSNDMELGIETKVKGIIEEKGIVAGDRRDHCLHPFAGRPGSGIEWSRNPEAAAGIAGRLYD